MNCMTYSSSNSFFQALIAYQYQLLFLILHQYFSKLFAMLIQELKEILQDLNDRFFYSFQKHQPKVMYHFQDTNHYINLNVLFQNLYKLFLHVCNLHP